jgi:ABC-type Fe3+-hydroxamate transport system substrate-binding protein
MRVVLSGFLLILSALPVGALAAPDRMVTLSPLLSEWVGELIGCDEAVKRIVGVSDYSDFPGCLSGKPSVGPYHRVSIEKVISLRPDLVLASQEYNREAIVRLRSLGIRVEILPKEGFRTMPAWIERLGAVLGARAEARRASESWGARIREFETLKRRGRKVFIEVQHDPLITVGADSFLDEAYRAMGFLNVFHDQREGYPRVSREAVLKADPDEIHILDLRGREKEFEQSRHSWERFPRLKAVRDRRIIRLPGEDFARCTPRLLRALKGLG